MSNSFDVSSLDLYNRCSDSSRLKNIKYHRNSFEGKYIADSKSHENIFCKTEENNSSNLEDLQEFILNINVQDEDLQKEFRSDIEDWERYITCKEHEERSKSTSSFAVPCVRNIDCENNIILLSKKCQNNLHNLNICNYSKMEIQTNESWDEVLNEEDEMQKTKQANVEKAKGNVYYKSKNYLKACEQYSKCIALNRSKDAYNNRAQAKMKLGNYWSALLDLNEVLKIDPNNIKALFRKATCRRAIRMYDEAIRDVQTLLKVKSGSGSARKLLMDIKNDMSKLNGKVYRIREHFGANKTFQVEVSQLSAYANCEDAYLLEVDKLGCAKNCVCGYCIAEDFRKRIKCNVLRIKERNKWKYLTNNLLNEMRIPIIKMEDFVKLENDENSLSNGLVNGDVNDVNNGCRNRTITKLPINLKNEFDLSNHCDNKDQYDVSNKISSCNENMSITKHKSVKNSENARYQQNNFNTNDSI